MHSLSHYSILSHKLCYLNWAGRRMGKWSSAPGSAESLIQFPSERTKNRRKCWWLVNTALKRPIYKIIIQFEIELSPNYNLGEFVFARRATSSCAATAQVLCQWFCSIFAKPSSLFVFACFSQFPRDWSVPNHKVPIPYGLFIIASALVSKTFSASVPAALFFICNYRKRTIVARIYGVELGRAGSRWAFVSGRLTVSSDCIINKVEWKFSEEKYEFLWHPYRRSFFSPDAPLSHLNRTVAVEMNGKKLKGNGV